MKLASSFAARAALQISLEDVGPSHGISLKLFIEEVRERYQFVNAPSLQSHQIVGQIGSGGSLQMSPFVLQQGVFDHDHTMSQITQLEIAPTPNLLAVTTYDTRIADAFLDDLITYLENRFGYRKIIDHSSRTYWSSVIVQFDEPLDKNLGALLEIERLLSTVYTSVAETELLVEFERITFSPDPLKVPAGILPKLTNFVIERRSLRPYSENRFFSTAPLRTEQHITVLEGIERILSR